MSAETSQALAGLSTAALAGTLGAVASGGTTAGAGAAFNADANNRQLHPTEARLIKDNAKRFARQLYGTEEPSAEQIEAAQALLANTAQNQLDNNLGVIVPYNEEANAFLQTLKIEYHQANGTLTLPGTAGGPGGAQQLFYANTEQKNMPWLNQGLADPAVTGLIVRTPINEASLPRPEPNTITSAANGCVTGECSGGVLPERNAVRDEADIREDAADIASGVGRGAGVVSSAATAAATVPGPHQPAAATTAVIATGAGFAADVVEQVAQPDTGKAVHEFFLGIAQTQVDNKLPLIAPVSNEVRTLWVESGAAEPFESWVNNRWNGVIKQLESAK